MGRQASKLKYRSKPITLDGIRFASLKEAERYQHLKFLERAGEIRDLKIHPKFPLTCDGKPLVLRSERYPNGRKVNYYADFEYIDCETGARVIEDVKGMDTQLSKLKRSIVEANYGVSVTIVR